MLETMDTLKGRLKEKGSKLTPQRRATLNVIIENKGEHLNTEEIYELVRKDCPEIGLATVYRTLQLLEEMDIISRINLDDGCSRYEIKTDDEDHQHHHLICQECSKIIEVKIDLLDHLEKEIEKEYDFDIKDHKLKFFGLCTDCKQK
ncbi:Fur family transcriptional regulator [Isachenkonia alkalipeptolytica]|uniref:Transcriptional repressor n=1 Tax=Isachenkonia alkalipeptolytica TaxID=2565777 RepID=A0AA43XKQ5_9CLOT|nr:Fur family transcriptional regulator [Isachenkonia alkalipeptolytica]NBG87635.1 transcriptional repressor [Isachenkonia alkalipeptolytica]